MSDLLLAAIILALAIIALAFFLVAGAGAYFLYQLAREKRLEAQATWNAPLPTPHDDLSDLDEDTKAARIDSILDFAKDQGRMAKDEWAAQKLEEGWTEDDIQTFLDNRPLLELN